MHNVKQVDLDKFEESKLDKFVEFTGWTFIQKIIDLYHIYSERVSRSLAFAKIGWLSHDFESLYLYDLMAFKLRRIQTILVNYSSHVEEPENLKALQEAIDICDRLFNGGYEHKYHEEHDKKWGEIIHDRIPHKHGSQVILSRPNVKTDEDKAQETKEFLEVYDKGAKDRADDIDRLAFLLKEYQPSWWD